jgi:hypothetical protein
MPQKSFLQKYKNKRGLTSLYDFADLPGDPLDIFCPTAQLSEQHYRCGDRF